ncbi:MAG: hypothetical protein SGCHY_005439 [Lobulomycetales sp.]
MKRANVASREVKKPSTGGSLPKGKSSAPVQRGRIHLNTPGSESSRRAAPAAEPFVKQGSELSKEADWALLDAVSVGDAEGVYSALWAGANSNCKKPVYKTQPLVIACRAGFKSIAPVLLKFKADLIGDPDCYGCTIFHWVANNNQVGIFEWLQNRLTARRGLEVSKYLNTRDSFGSTPLHFASAKGHVDMCRALVEAGSDPTISNNDGKRPSEVTSYKVTRQVTIVGELSKFLGSAESSYVRQVQQPGKKGKGRVTNTAISRKKKTPTSMAAPGAKRRSTLALAPNSDTEAHGSKPSAGSLRDATTGRKTTSKPTNLLRKSLRELDKASKKDQTKRSSVELSMPVLSVP